jgi:aspartate/methionine/tyrosine aminotransferase
MVDDVSRETLSVPQLAPFGALCYTSFGTTSMKTGHAIFAFYNVERNRRELRVVISHDFPVDSSDSFNLQEQRSILRQLRQVLIQRYRPILQQGAGPIRVMARLVNELESQCRERRLSPEVIRSEIVNRTIGDVNVRSITECEGEHGGSGDYRLLAEDLGVALPGEQLSDYVATGETYLWLRDQMQHLERELLQQGIDLRIYDILGVGNPVLRSKLAGHVRPWGIQATAEQVYLGLGAMDSLDKVLRGLAYVSRETGQMPIGILFPEPGFGVPEWQAASYGYTLHRFQTHAANNFKLTSQQLDDLLQQAPDIRVIYLTVTSNPSTFSYTPEELNALYTVLRTYWETGREVLLLADLAYIGTGVPAEDEARMLTFATQDVWQHTIFAHSFSKTHTLTGERFGWVTIGNPQLATGISPAWSNSAASLPGDWQLRFLAYLKLIEERPWLSEKLRAFYRFRRKRLAEQLRKIDAEQHLFSQIYLGDDATVYNWSQLRAGEDAFSLFEKTGIAGVPGSGFGYTDDFVRFSIGVIPIPD